jgi:hypothetical protein
MPEIEPLSDVRWARIEQSLLEQLEQLPLAPREPVAHLPAAVAGAKLTGPRVLVGTFAAVVAVAAAVALFVFNPSSRVATSRVATEASPSHVTIGEASIDLSPESGIVVREEEHATVLVLERGEVALHVAPRPKDRPFLVEAGEVHVRVVGTEFSVRRSGVGAVVNVRRGIVEVTAHGEVARLKAGEGWPDGVATTGSAGGGPALNLNPGVTSGPALDRAPAPASPAVLEPLASVAGASRSDSTAAHAAVSREHTVSRPAAGGGSAAAHASAVMAAPPLPAAAPATLPPPAIAVAPPVPSSPDAAPSAIPTSSQARYEAAEQIERKDPDGALSAYTALARGSDAWAQNALFAAGRLQADRGARADAIRLLGEYLRRFPRGPNAQDARTLREALR